MAQLEYGLSLVSNRMTFLPRMYPAIPCPEGALEEWSVVYNNGDGSTVGDGYPKEIWKFEFLTQEQVNKLRSFVGLAFGAVSRQVYLRTKDPFGIFYTFRAIMHWPADAATKRDRQGIYRDLEITFTQLELVA